MFRTGDPTLPRGVRDECERQHSVLRLGQLDVLQVLARRGLALLFRHLGILVSVNLRGVVRGERAESESGLKGRRVGWLVILLVVGYMFLCNYI
ncbi:hypothetical protein EON65_47080 [archaeon]|nr:MAG: hypothetical protein EON65_47080 [archaeon]